MITFCGNVFTVYPQHLGNKDMYIQINKRTNTLFSARGWQSPDNNKHPFLCNRMTISGQPIGQEWVTQWGLSCQLSPVPCHYTVLITRSFQATLDASCATLDLRLSQTRVTQAVIRHHSISSVCQSSCSFGLPLPINSWAVSISHFL